MENIIFSIGRQFGSGGKEISINLAERLGINCYDNELLAKTAADSGLCEEVIRDSDEKPIRGFFQSIGSPSYHMTNYSAAMFSELPLNHKVFLAQFETIRNLSQQESCVIVGRCADYALAEYPLCLSVFIHANMDFRLGRVKKDVDINDDEKLMDYIQKADKKRANYYNYFSGKKWGDAKSYDLCIDSSKLGIEKSVEMIIAYAKLRFPELAGILNK